MGSDEKPQMLGDMWSNYLLTWNITYMTLANHEYEVPQGAIVPFSATILALQLAVGAPASILILYLIASKKELRSATVNHIIFNISLSELYLQLLFVCGHLYYFLIDSNEVVCGVTAFLLWHCSGACSSLYTQLAVNHYVAFFHDVHLDRVYTPRNTRMMLVATWLVTGVIIVPMLPFMGYDATHVCGINTKHSVLATLYYHFFLIIGAGLCGPVQLLCNIKVSLKLRKHRRAMASRGFKSKSIKTDAMLNVTRVLYFHAIGAQAFVLPMLVARFVPGIEAWPWVGRCAWLWVGMDMCVSPYILICWMRPLRSAAKEFLAATLAILKLSRVANNVVESQRQPSGDQGSATGTVRVAASAPQVTSHS